MKMVDNYYVKKNRNGHGLVVKELDLVSDDYRLAECLSDCCR